MALTFDVTLKDMARDCPEGFLAEFDRRPGSPLKLLNVDLATVTRSGDLGLTPLAMLARLPERVSLEDGLKTVVRQIVDRVTVEAPPERAKKLLTVALLLRGLRVRRDVALKIFRGVPMMQESDTYLMILEEGEEKATKELIMGLGEPRLGRPDESVLETLKSITDLRRLKRIALAAPSAASWHELIETR